MKLYQFSLSTIPIEKIKKHPNVTEFRRSSELRTAVELCRFLGRFDLAIKPYAIVRYLQYFFSKNMDMVRNSCQNL